MSKRTSAVGVLVLVLGIAIGWLAGSPNTSTPQAAAAISAPANDSINGTPISAEPTVNANGDSVMTTIQVDVTHNEVTAFDKDGKNVGTLQITRHYDSTDEQQQIGLPTFEILGEPTRPMICTAAHDTAMYGSDHPAQDAQRVKDLCDQFNTDAATGATINCAKDLDSLLGTINPDASYDGQMTLTNGQTSLLCNDTRQPQDDTSSYYSGS